MHDKICTKPIVTSALTHGLGIVGDLFVNQGDTILLPDKFWGNYRLIYEVRFNAKLVTYPFYNDQGTFNVEGFRQTLKEAGRHGKVLVIINFPNNPLGYSITPSEGDAIVAAVEETADMGVNIIVILDEAYFGLFYEDDLLKESLFGHMANRHERILAIKLDGATKEEFVWGFRVGFLTYGAGNLGNLNDIYNALEKKTMGAIRGYISNSSHIAQTLILKTLESPEFPGQRAEKISILKRRAQKVREVLKNPEYDTVWSVYPFNAGYFMCLKLKHVDAERLRLHLLNRFGIGIIATGPNDIRIAFSCVEESDIPELFESLYIGVRDLTG